MIALLLAGLGWAADPPECRVALSDPPDKLSVAWISPLGARVSARGYLSVVPTSALREWVADERPSIGRLLQHLGEQKKADDPKKRYKVTIFEVRADTLCRPLAGYDDPRSVDGVVTCPSNRSEVNRAYDGCGTLIDRADGSPSFEVFRLQWTDAATNGFCVLPIERMVSPERP